MHIVTYTFAVLFVVWSGQESSQMALNAIMQTEMHHPTVTVSMQEAKMTDVTKEFPLKTSVNDH